LLRVRRRRIDFTRREQGPAVPGRSFLRRSRSASKRLLETRLALYLSVRQWRARKCRRTHIYSYPTCLLSFAFCFSWRKKSQRSKVNVLLLTTVISILYASQHACAAWRPNEQTIAHAARAGSRDASTKPTAFFSLAHRIHAGGTSHCMFCSFANGMASSSRLQSADTLVGFLLGRCPVRQTHSA